MVSGQWEGIGSRLGLALQGLFFEKGLEPCAWAVAPWTRSTVPVRYDPLWQTVTGCGPLPGTVPHTPSTCTPQGTVERGGGGEGGNEHAEQL